MWKDYGKNKESVGQLWVSMLRYYTEVFNWKENVVTIRQYAPLTRLQKLWNSRCIVIEDPFDLSHNLGAGLSRKSKFSFPPAKRFKFTFVGVYYVKFFNDFCSLVIKQLWKILGNLHFVLY